MPQMGVSVAEGTIVEWLKRPGDWVEADETVCVVTTDKVDVEIPSPASGRLERILVEPDETVAVGTPLAEIDSGARPGEAHREEEAEAAAEAEAATDGPEACGGRRRPRHRRRRAQMTLTGRGFYSPVVRRIADEHGVDLDAVEGTGIGGRVRKRDLVAHLENGGAATAEQAGPRRAAASHRVALPARSPRPRRAPKPRRPARAGDRGRRREPMSPMRRRIAEHMLESRRTSAHCTTIVEVDLPAVVATRKQQKEAMAARGAPLTYLAFVAQATVAALQRHPVLNASIEGEELVYHDDVNLGIAVALDAGLIVPVIRQAQRLSLEGMAAAIAERARAARSGGLEPDDVAGGTFTITNPGAVRRRPGDADHQPAAGRDPRPGGRGQAARRDRRRMTAATRSRSGR